MHGQCSVGYVKGVAESRSFKKSLVIKKTVDFVRIPFSSSRQSSELILGILLSMRDRPEGRDRATPIFRYKMITIKRMNIFP